MNEDYLAHHGVKDMHWGVRNAETLARYARERGGGVKKQRFSEAIKEGARRRVTSRVETAKSNALKRISGEAKAEAKSRGYDKIKDYQNARNKALYSHDPAVVAKYASTLTDKELENKLKRLRLEKQALDMVPPKTKSAGEQAMSNFITSFGSTAGSNMGQIIPKIIGAKLGVSGDNKKQNQGDQPKTDKKQNQPDKPKQQNNGSGSDQSPSATASSAAMFNINVNLGSKTSADAKSTINDARNKDIIDVKPISASSERETKKFLSKFKKN